MNSRKIYWKLWCEYVRYLIERKSLGSSLSETTAGSSTSISTCIISNNIENIKKAEQNNDNDFLKSITCYEGAAGDSIRNKWTENNIYLGLPYKEHKNARYLPTPVHIAGQSLRMVK